MLKQETTLSGNLGLALQAGEERAAGAATSGRGESGEAAIRQLRGALFAGGAQRAIALTSCFAGEGVTTLAGRLAQSVSGAGAAAVLVDQAQYRGSLGELQAVVRAARNDGASVVIDAGSLEASAAALDLTGLVDGVVLVVEAGRCRPEDLAAAVAKLERAGLTVLGTVLNRFRRVLPALIGD